MKWNLKRTKLLFGLIPIMAIVFYLMTANNSIYADQTYVPIDVNTQINDVMNARPDTLPDDYSPRENFAIAAGAIVAEPFYRSVTTGKVVANIMNYTQTVSNFKAVKDGAVFAESISLSTFASVAEQKFFRDGYIMYRKGNTKGSSVSSWPEKVIEMDSAVYGQRYGVIPREICKYSITGESYLTGELVSKQDGLYTYKIKLNAQQAQKYGMREMMTFAGVTQEPKFESCEITYTIDKNWRVHTVESEDYYSIAMMGGTKCHSTLREEFTYEGDMPERAQIFLDYTPTGDSSDIVIEKGPADYLQSAFGPYIAGTKPLYLSADVDALGSTLALKAALDIPNNDFTFAVGNDLLLAYNKDGLFVKTGESKLKTSSKALGGLMQALGVDAGALTGAFDDPNLLEKLFENSEIIKTDTHVHITMPFELFGVNFDVDMALKIIDDKENVTADTITATIDLSALTGQSTVVKAAVHITDTLTLPTVDAATYTSLDPLLTAIGNTAAAKQFDVSAQLKLTANDFSTTIDANALVNVTDGGITFDAELLALNQRLRLAYDGDSGYASLGNLRLKGTEDDLLQTVLSLATTFGIDLSSLTDVDLGALLPVLGNAVLPKDPTLDSVLQILTTLSYDGTSLGIFTLPASGSKLSLSLSHDAQKLTQFSLKGLRLGDVGLDVTAALNHIGAEPGIVKVENKDSYINVYDLTPFASVVKQLMDAKTYAFDVRLNGAAWGLSGEITGKIQLVRGDTLGFEAELFLNGNPESRVYLAFTDQTIYAEIGAFKLKCSTAEGLNGLLEEIQAAASQYPGLLPQIGQESSAKMIEGILSMLCITSDINGILDGLIGSIESLSLQNETLSLQLHLGNMQVCVSLTHRLGQISSLQLTDFRLTDGTDTIVGGNLTLSAVKILPTAEPITVTDTGYLDAALLRPLIRPVFAAAAAKTYDLTFTLNVTEQATGRTEKVSGSLKLVRTPQGVQVAAAIRLMGQSIDVLVQNNIIYLRVQNILLQVNTNNLSQLTDDLAALLPDSDAASLAPILAQVLPKLDFAGITGALSSITLQGNTIGLTVTPEAGTPYTLSLTVSDTAQFSLSNLTIMGYTAKLSAEMTHKPQADTVGFTGGLTAADYLDVAELARFIPSIKPLLQNQTYRLHVTGGELNTAFIGGQLSGDITVVRSPSLAFQARLQLNAHQIELSYIDETVYIKINDIRLRFKLTDIADLANQIQELVPSFDASAVTGILDALLGNTNKPPYQSDGILDALLGGADINSILSMVSGIGLNDDGKLCITLSNGELSVSLAMDVDSSGNLTLDVTNLNYGGLVTDSSIYTRLESLPQALPLFVAEQDTYVNLKDLSSYIRPVVDTVRQDYFTIDCTGSVTAKTGDVTAIAAQLKVQPTTHLADIYLHINLQTKGAVTDLSAYVLDNRTFDENGDVTGGDIAAYVDYNGFKVRIDFQNVLKIVGMVKDILGLKIPMLDSLLEGVYVPQDTSVFDSMDIVGINELREQINGLFAATDGVDNAENLFDKLFSSLTADFIDAALSGVKLYYDSQTETLGLRIDNGLFDPLNKNQLADIQITQDAQRLRAVSISNLIVNGNHVDFRADLSCVPFDKITVPDGFLDFNGITDLLGSVINTANMRAFQINGSAKMSVFGLLNTDVDIDAKIKILDDGSTVAAIKLKTKYVFTALNQTESYIYFVNNRLYFIVDVYKDGAFANDSYKRTQIESCTIEEFLADPMRYIFTAIQLDDFYKNMIPPLSSGGGASTPIQQILKAYSFDGTNHRIKIGLAEVAGNSDLSDLNLTLTTDQGYVTGLNLDTSFVGGITLGLGEGAKLNNIRYQDGVPVGANPVTGLTLGAKYGAVDSFETLEDKLAEVFPMQAAQDLASKLDGYGTKAATAAKKAEQSVQSAIAAVLEVQKAERALSEAQAALADAEPGTFGYDLLLSRVSGAQTTLDSALKKRTEAEKTRVTAANDARIRATRLIGAIDKTATAAQRALTLNTPTGYNAAAKAANSTVLAIYIAKSTLLSAQTAAMAAEDAGLVSQIQTTLDSLNALTPDAAKKAADTALTSIERLIASVRATAQEALNAQNAQNADTAMTKAAETLDAISALRNATAAASYAASLSNDLALLQRADEAKTNAELAESDCANSAANAAIFAAEQFAQLSESDADNARTKAESGDADGAITAATSAIGLTHKAETAVKGALKAAALITDDLLKAKAEQAAQTAEQAVLNVGDNLSPAMKLAAETKYSAANNTVVSANSVNSLNTAISALEGADAAVQLLKTAVSFHATQINKDLLNAAQSLSKQTLFSFAPQFTSALNHLIETDSVAVNAAVNTANNARDKASGVGLFGNYSAQKNAANALKTRAEQSEQLTKTVTRFAAYMSKAVSDLYAIDKDSAAEYVALIQNCAALSSGTAMQNNIDALTNSGTAMQNAGSQLSAAVAKGTWNAYRQGAVDAANAAASAAGNVLTQVNEAVSAIEDLLRLAISLQPA